MSIQQEDTPQVNTTNTNVDRTLTKMPDQPNPRDNMIFAEDRVGERGRGRDRNDGPPPPPPPPADEPEEPEEPEA